VSGIGPKQIGRKSDEAKKRIVRQKVRPPGISISQILRNSNDALQGWKIIYVTGNSFVVTTFVHSKASD